MCQYLCACVCPPCAVLYKRGCGCHFLLNVFLSLLGVVPGCCHACIVVSEDRDEKIVVVTTPPQPSSVVINIPDRNYPAPVHASAPPPAYYEQKY